MPTENPIYRSLERVESRLGDLEKEVHLAAADVAAEAGSLKSQVEALKEQIDKLVTRHEFTPVKMLVYGLTGSTLAGVVGAIMSKVLTK